MLMYVLYVQKHLQNSVKNSERRGRYVGARFKTRTSLLLFQIGKITSYEYFKN